MSTVEDWLRSLGLIQYTQSFLDNGYDELEICKEIGEEDLDAIGVNNVKDRVDILSAVHRLNQSGTAVYFVLEEGSQPTCTPATQAREKIIPLKLKLLIRDTLEEDNIKLSEYPYTIKNGLRGNLENLVTLYADKFYTYEEDVFDALENIRVRQVGEMQEELRNQKDKEATPLATEVNSATTISSKHHQRSNTTPLHSNMSGWHTAPSSLTTKNVDPADYLDVDTHSSPHKKHKRRRPVERNSKLSRSLDSLKELHVNTDLKAKVDKDTSTSKPSNKLFGIFRGSKKRNASQEDKSQDIKSNTLTKSVAGAEYTASDITMGEEDRKALMLMVKNKELTVEEAVQQMKSYEKEHKKDSKQDATRAIRSSSSCSEEESPKGQHKLKRGLFGRSTKKKTISRPGSEIAACDMTMSEEDRIALMKNVRDHKITVENALQKLSSFEENSYNQKPKPAKPKFSPKSPHSSFSRLSIKRVSGAFSTAVKGGPPRDEPTAVFYTPQEGSVNTSSEEESSTQLPSDSSPDPSPAGHRKTGHELLKNAKHNQIHSTSSLHSSSGSSDAVDRLGTIEDADSEDSLVKRGVSAPENQILNEMKNIFAKKGAGDIEQGNLPAQTSSLPRNGRPKNPSLSRKSSLPLTPTHKPPPHTPPTHPTRKAPPPPPRAFPRQATAPSLHTPGTENDKESLLTKPAPKEPPLLPPRSDLDEKPPVPPLPPAKDHDQRQHNLDKSEHLKDLPSKIINNSVNSNRYSLDDDVFPPPPPEVLLTGEPEVPAKNIIVKPPRPSIKKPEKVLFKGGDDTPNTAPVTHDKEPPTVPQSSPGAPPVTKPKPLVKKKPKLPPKPPAKPGPLFKEDMEEKNDEVPNEDTSSLNVPDLPVPKKRPSHSLSDLIERRLRIEQIDLTESPYTGKDGCWSVPINLVDRYTEEMRRSQKEIVDIMDRIRCRKLREKKQRLVPCDLSLYPQEPDHLGEITSLEDWLVSLGLPMYIDNLKEVEYDDMTVMPHLKQKHFEYAGVVDLRHMRRLLASVERMPR